MVKIEYYGTIALFFGHSAGESAVKWPEENKKKVEECLSFIRNSPFSDELQSPF
jgi:hypothetical protein